MEPVSNQETATGSKSRSPPVNQVSDTREVKPTRSDLENHRLTAGLVSNQETTAGSQSRSPPFNQVSDSREVKPTRSELEARVEFIQNLCQEIWRH